MEVMVRFLGIYRDFAGHPEGVYALDEPATVGNLVDHLTEQHEKLAAFRKDIRVLVNGRGATMDQSIAEDDEIVLVDPISGGSLATR